MGLSERATVLKRIIALFLTYVMAVVLVGCMSGGSAIQESNQDTSGSSGSTATSSSALSADKMTIEKEYWIPSIGERYWHVVVFRNNNSVTCYVSAYTELYDSNHTLLEVSKTASGSVAPGYTGIYYEMFDRIDPNGTREIQLTVKPGEFYKEIDSILSVEVVRTDDRLFVTFTNNGNYDIESACANIVFLDSTGQAVDFTYISVLDSDGKLSPGESATGEYKFSVLTKEFASVEVYPTGVGI